MIDIATATPLLNPAAPHQIGRVPFDWCLIDTNQTADQVWHDASNLCAGVAQHSGPLKQYELVMEASMHTAVILSLFTDARAGSSDVLPLNQTHRRGWVGGSFVPRAGFRTVSDFGSRLWVIYSSKADDDPLEYARFAAYESLAWLIDERVVESIEVTAAWRGASQTTLGLQVQMFKGNTNQPIYNALWGTTLQRTPSLP